MSDGFTVQLGDLLLTDDGDSDGVSWRVTDIDAFFATAASTLSPVQKTRADGAWLSPRNQTAKTIPFAGLIDAPDRPTAYAALDKLRAAVAVQAGALLSVDVDGSTRWSTVYRSDQVLPVWVTDTVVQYSAQVVATDPRAFTEDVSAATGLPSAVGGLTIPFTIPFAISSTVVTGNCILINPGTATGPIRLRIDGPITGPAVTHVSTGLALVFASSLTLGAGEWLDVDMEAQTVLANGTASRNGYVTSRQWFGFDPGPNVFAFSATSGTGTLTVTGTPAW